MLNKIDIVAAEKVAEIQHEIAMEMKWQQPVFCVSAATGKGCDVLIKAIFQWLSEREVEG